MHNTLIQRGIKLIRTSSSQMNTLIKLTSQFLEIPTTRVIFLAYEYAERIPKQRKEKEKIVRVIYRNGITPEVEEFCLNTLAGRATPIQKERI